MRTVHLTAFLLSAVIFAFGCGEYAEYMEDSPDHHQQSQPQVPEEYFAEYQRLTEEIASYHDSPVPQNIGPDHARLHTRLGIILYEIKDWRGAKENFERGIKMYSGDPEAHLYLGRTFREMERYQEAVSEFEISLKLDPGLQAAHGELAETYERMGLTEKAEAEKILEGDKN